MITTVKAIDIDNGWQWKERDTSFPSALDEPGHSSAWRVAQTFPSEIHVELLKAGMISDLYVEFNEHKVQWIGPREWLYKTSFSLDGLPERAKNYQFIFEGLDTYAEVYLNGSNILSSANQFRTYIVDIERSALRHENTLLPHFKFAFLLGKELETQYGRVRAGSCNPDASRVYIRKAQYDWRWDWVNILSQSFGPELMTTGPYRPIRLIAYDSRLVLLLIKAHVSASLDTSFVLDIVLKGTASLVDAARVTIRHIAEDRVVREEGVCLKNFIFQEANGHSVAKDVVKWAFTENEVELWWPVKYGKQALYEVLVDLVDQKNGEILDTKVQRIGFRRIQLIQEPLQESDQYGQGTTFLFEINNVRIFMGERYRAWLTLLRDGNQNMVHLWGGGVFEPDVFYDTCDQLGILIWQDFQFSCGIYPAHKAFVENVRCEAEDNVCRLRHHPSLALFCGNNEDYQQVLQWDVETNLPALVLYEDVLPSVVERLTSPRIPYHRGSSYATPLLIIVSHISEFGMPSMPDLRTIYYWMGSLRDNEREHYVQAPIMAQHCRAGQFERRFAIALNENFRLTSDLETYVRTLFMTIHNPFINLLGRSADKSHVYNTQMMRSEAVSYAYRVWRREWRGRGKEYTAGVLVWQLNDCWPVTSWAIADYFVVTSKASVLYHRARAQVNYRWYPALSRKKPEKTIDLNSSTNLELFKRAMRQLLSGAQIARLISVDYCSYFPLTTSALPGTLLYTRTHSYERPTGSSVVVSAKLVNEDTGEVVAQYADWPQPFKYLHLPTTAEVNAKVSGEQVRVSVVRPVKGLVFSVAEEDGGKVRWSDNALDVIPGNDQVIIAEGLQERNILAAWLGSEKAKLV
ncbi:hypothetical protein EW146_g6196 [Bondarzewia mesenterica]|uniref:beta-mannosidase n=1 Tax=Bondarzewia mesenterica TaxID=1095465 RepID=A0A4V3XEM1_9AGAM|nr:hypothetical protein EW146_g6196 [Bondarzewia mesenterica]